MKISRRVLIKKGAVLAGTIGISAVAWADSPVPLAESDPMAQALGYKADASQVDKAKFPTYAAGQTCANCVLYQGKPGDASGPCPIYAGKLVASKGWCSSYAKKS
jgi:hypothetical protein